MSKKGGESKMQLTEIQDINENNGVLTFKIKGNVSIANGLRRTLLQNIPTVCIQTEPYNEVSEPLTSIIIYENTTSFTNEILKQRLACIPVHIKDLDPEKIDNLILEVEKENTGNSVEYITTEDFKIKDKVTNRYLNKDAVKKIFPPSSLTGDYILFSRLKPGMSKKFPGQKLKLACKLFISTAKVSGQYNVCSTAAYSNTPDPIMQDASWNEKEEQLRESGMVESDIAKKKINWDLHDSKKYYVPNSFNFKLETIGVFKNEELIKKACSVLVVRFANLLEKVQNNEITYKKDTVNIKNSYDIILPNIDYTLGKTIEYIMHERFLEKNKKFNYVGFIKKHPHDDFSIIRVVFSKDEQGDGESGIDNLKNILAAAIDYSMKHYNNINDSFI